MQDKTISQPDTGVVSAKCGTRSGDWHLYCRIDHL